MQVNDGFQITDNISIFNKLKSSVLNVDPVYFCENYLTLDGKPFRLRGNGYKPFIDIYRYLGVKSLEKNTKPIILVKGRQVGATTMAAAIEMYWMGCGMFGTNNRAPMRVMHCFPHLILAAAYTKTKLNPIITQSIPVTDKNAKKPKSYMSSLIGSHVNDSLQYKEFQNGNHIWIESIGIDGGRVRGRTVDGIIFDEVQDMPEEAISNSLKTMSKAQYGVVGSGVQIYMGTPLGKDSKYYEMWNDSSKQYYHLHCEKCEKYFPLYTPDSTDWEKIWVYGHTVKCPHCNHLQNKIDATERGKWIATVNPEKAKLVGYHINQLYMPDFTREKLDAEKPGKHPINTERAWMNEVLGEFYTGQGLIITADQIRKNCADFERKMRVRILPSENKLVFLGADWGKKVDADVRDGQKKTSQGQSYNTIVILSAEGPELFNIQFATLLKDNDVQYKIEIIDQAYINYNVTLGVGDLGYAGDLSQILQNKYGDKFLVSEARGSLIKRISYKDDIFPKSIMFDKNYYTEKLFSLMKRGAIRFPFGSFDRIAWLVSHCTSMEIKMTKDMANNIKVTYVKGLTPNDGFSALMNAYLAYEFYITDGFKKMNSLFEKDMTQFTVGEHKIDAIGVRLPGMRLTR